MLQMLPIESDVQVWKPHLQVDDTYTSMTLGFFLLCSDSLAVDDNGSSAAPAATFSCTQGKGGHMTHFFVGNYHAVSFAIWQQYSRPVSAGHVNNISKKQQSKQSKLHHGAVVAASTIAVAVLQGVKVNAIETG